MYQQTSDQTPNHPNPNPNPNPFLHQLHLTIPYTLPTPTCALHLHPSLNNTFILSTLKPSPPPKTTKTTVIRHITLHGETIKQLDLGEASLMRLFTITQRYAVIGVFLLRERKGGVLQWDLDDGGVFGCWWECQWWGELMVFSESMLVCVIQKTNHKIQNTNTNHKSNTKISYFQFPLTKNQQQPTHIFMPEDTECLTFYDEVRKINNHSGICWVKVNDFDRDLDLDYLTFHILDLRSPKPPKISSHKLPNPIPSLIPPLPSPTLFSCGISDIWQPLQGQFYIKCRVQLSLPKYKNSQVKKTHIEIQQLLGEKRVCEFFYWVESGEVERFGDGDGRREGVVQFMSGLREVSRFVKSDQRTHLFTNSYRPWQSQQYHQLPIHYLHPKTHQILFTQLPQQGPTYSQNTQTCYVDSDHFFYMDYIVELLYWSAGEYFVNVSVRMVKVRDGMLGLGIGMGEGEGMGGEGGIVGGFFMEEVVEGVDQDLVFLVVGMVGCEMEENCIDLRGYMK